MEKIAEDRALALYVVAAYDLSDFIDMLRENESTIESLEFLAEMCLHPTEKEEDRELNTFILPFVESELRRRKR